MKTTVALLLSVPGGRSGGEKIQRLCRARKRGRNQTLQSKRDNADALPRVGVGEDGGGGEDGWSVVGVEKREGRWTDGTQGADQAGY